MSELLCIDIKTLEDGEFQFCQTGLICKVLEAIGMDNCNGFSTSTKVESPLGSDKNGYEDNIYWPSSYDYFIGMIVYLVSNTITDISCAINQCASFIHNIKVSHEKFVKRKFRCLQGTK